MRKKFNTLNDVEDYCLFSFVCVCATYDFLSNPKHYLVLPTNYRI